MKKLGLIIALFAMLSVIGIAYGSVPSLVISNSSTVMVNATNGTFISVIAPDGANITAIILPGTDALIANKTFSSYNFTIATFTIKNNSLSAPPGESGAIPAYGFAFEINGHISPSISLVNNSTGAPDPAITVAEYNQSWSSCTLLGGQFNGGTYTGGSYAFQNNWTYNSTVGGIVNFDFSSPAMWIFTYLPNGQQSNSTTNSSATASTTVASSGASSSTSPYVYIIIVIVVIIVIGAVVYALSMRGGKKNSDQSATTNATDTSSTSSTSTNTSSSSKKKKKSTTS